ncbi:MAG: cell division protein ZapA [Pseudomonadota bacterium]
MSDSETVTVSILDKNYQVNCGPDEVAALHQSARLLDEKMREIKDASTVLGLDRIAVMAALNIANDLLIRGQEIDNTEQDFRQLDTKLSQALKRAQTRN